MAQISKTSHIPDCTNKCHSTIHGDIITSAVTKKAVRDQDLCVYLNYVCCCCESVRDTQGRTALHVAASCGRVNLLQWLVQKRLANVNTRDVESGYTPLHRSIFYGKLETAVQLLKMGANATIQDADGLTFIEHAMLDGPSPDKSDSGEVYTWGTNCNNALGPQQSRNVPDILDVFHKKYPNEFVKQICLSQFHSVIVTVSGKCYSCGHGQGGRLGLGIQHTEVTPKRINFPDKSQSDFVCVQASISRDHSLFLTIDGNIYACGSNKHYVLGISPPPDQLLVPKQLKSLPIHLKGVDVGYYHSLAWGPKGLYTWGLNGGQLGHQLNNKNDDKFIFTPKLVKVFNYNEISLKLVCCSNGATIVYTKKGDLYALHEYQCKKIASRQLNLVQISSVGGKLNCTLDSTLSSKENRGLKVAALTNAGNLLIWQESDQTLLRCVFSVNRALVLKQFILNLNEVLFITNNGEGFRGAFKARKKKPTSEEDSSSAKSEFHKFLEKDQCIFVKLQKLPRIHRALNVQSDLKGENYCIIQENSGKVSFPFSASAVLALLEFLYTDSLSALENRDIDQLFKILIMADQFFVVRLKEECEFLLSNLLSLKNAIQLLRLANAYNAQKLKYCCMNFIVSNIAPFLELRLLDELEQELLQQLSQAYYENNPQLWCRVITPYSTAVSDEEVVMVSVRFPIDLDEESVKMKSKSNSRKRIRSHKVSVSETSLTKPKAHVLNRSGIGVGSLNLDKGEFEDKFTVLSKKTDEINLSSSFTDDNEFPLLELNSPLTSVWYGNKQHKNEKHRMNKVSQKQRKRLSSQNNESEKGESLETIEKKNPWKMDLTIGSPNNSTLEDNMENIMESEKRQKENLIKIKSKSLALTQLEDKAIEELRSFYNIENTVDEVITIERVSIGVIASPVWVPKIK
ncbi:inhibitor of Bruton tyrosine kinase isoform X4 [Cylas formicarius]|uniref:inhibitor of Bruton tyrosine kinase isoform X4 n=1 Tax=Cylas formicarius TaxID=197179 RepID=UPI002958A99A|nr:inhibitor of Bruton tyrosine kinase isoform X4 [Cylas formicarius]